MPFIQMRTLGEQEAGQRSDPLELADFINAAFALGAAIFCAYFPVGVLPQLELLYADLGGWLPPPTEFVFQQRWLGPAISLLVLGALGFGFFSQSSLRVRRRVILVAMWTGTAGAAGLIFCAWLPASQLALPGGQR